MFVVKKLGRNGLWSAVSLIDKNGSFRGEAKFETLKEAEDYLAEYLKRMKDRLVITPKEQDSLRYLKKSRINLKDWRGLYTILFVYDLLRDTFLHHFHSSFAFYNTSLASLTYSINYFASRRDLMNKPHRLTCERSDLVISYSSYGSYY